MSSSRSDVVTHFVRSFVRNQGVFCSHKTLSWVIGSKRGVKVVQKGCFKGDSRVSLGCLQSVFQGCFTKVSRVFQGSFKGVSRKFQGCFTKVSRVFHESFNGVLRKF